MVDLDLDALEAAARAATPGKRLTCDDASTADGIMLSIDPDRGVALADEHGYPWRVFITLNVNFPSRADVEFIAAASPDVVLALVARLRAAEALLLAVLPKCDAGDCDAYATRGLVILGPDEDCDDIDFGRCEAHATKKHVDFDEACVLPHVEQLRAWLALRGAP